MHPQGGRKKTTGPRAMVQFSPDSNDGSACLIGCVYISEWAPQGSSNHIGRGGVQWDRPQRNNVVRREKDRTEVPGGMVMAPVVEGGKGSGKLGGGGTVGPIPSLLSYSHPASPCSLPFAPRVHLSRTPPRTTSLSCVVQIQRR
ncbi:hypothetical protein CRG98_029360 [Punica granatum]|uniref:Uncharacterized protein n=1 Tax=Punica granatum TaxID=22663 RepID=A0A2I0J220_PUNGR|nr:hypothetical protein CRG98_029360 [Punica granatum]